MKKFLTRVLFGAMAIIIAALILEHHVESGAREIACALSPTERVVRTEEIFVKAVRLHKEAVETFGEDSAEATSAFQLIANTVSAMRDAVEDAMAETEGNLFKEAVALRDEVELLRKELAGAEARGYVRGLIVGAQQN